MLAAKGGEEDRDYNLIWNKSEGEIEQIRRVSGFQWGWQFFFYQKVLAKGSRDAHWVAPLRLNPLFEQKC